MNSCFEIRGFNLCESILRHTPQQLTRFIRRMKSLDANTLIVHSDYGWQRRQELITRECKAANVNIILMSFGPRTMLRMVPWKISYFAKDENGVPYCRQPECESWLCVSNPEALEAFGEGAKKYLALLPSGIKYFHLRAPDGYDICRCPGCRNLSKQDQWAIPLAVFKEQARKLRPDLVLESDLYIGRYRPPQKEQIFTDLDRIMYDTFFRHPFFPLGSTLDSANAACLHYADANPDAPTPNSFHAKRLKEWSRLVPGKIYIHENLMLQAYLGVFQHNTGSLLQDQQFYRSLGLRGVCYEAFEPGFANFEPGIRTLMAGLKDPELCQKYRPDALESALQTSGMNMFCTDMSFPLEKYLTDPFELRHVQYFRRFWSDFTPEWFREFLEFCLENPDRCDPLMAAWRIAKSGLARKLISFDHPTETAAELLSKRKLWDFMEDLDCSDPRSVALDAVQSLLRSVRKK